MKLLIHDGDVNPNPGPDNDNNNNQTSQFVIELTKTGLRIQNWLVEHQNLLADSKFEQIKLLMTSSYHTQNTCSISNWDIFEACGVGFYLWNIWFRSRNHLFHKWCSEKTDLEIEGRWYSCIRIWKIESMFSSSFDRFRRLKIDMQWALNWNFYRQLWQKLTNPAEKVREDLLNNPVFRAKSSHPLSPVDIKWSTRRQYRPHLRARFVHS